MWHKSGRVPILHSFDFGASCHTRLAALVIQPVGADAMALPTLIPQGRGKADKSYLDRSKIGAQRNRGAGAHGGARSRIESGTGKPRSLLELPASHVSSPALASADV